MDADALARANALVGNAAGPRRSRSPLVGPELEALEAATVAIAGADLAAEVNGRPAPLGEAFRGAASGIGCASAGRAAGRRALPRGRGRRRKGPADGAVRGGGQDAVGSRRSAAGPRSHGARPSGERSGREILLRVILGPQADHFPQAAIEPFLLSGSWSVSADERPAGAAARGRAARARPGAEIPPEGAVPGSIQVPGGGLPIVLGPDGPVTGGYPKIATVIGADLPLLGPGGPGGPAAICGRVPRQALDARGIPSRSTISLP